MTRSIPRSVPERLLGNDEIEAGELRASRARGVAEGYAERRRLEGKLHDGVQQHLVALIVNLQLARELVETDPAALSALLDEMARDLREALEGVRELAHEIYPPLLLDRGLLVAIDAAASAAAIPTRVEATSLDRYPEDLEATVYFCCVDALNGGASRSATGATVRIWQDGPALNFEVAYDGQGVNSHGGLPIACVSSMQDRIGAVGGLLTVAASPAGGSRVSGTIPLGP